MKNTLLLLFLLILPISVHSQITFNDLKKIDSKEDFKRLCIEQGYAYLKELDEPESHITFYALIDKEGRDVAFAEYYVGTLARLYGFSFYLADDEQHRTYQRITADIKQNCNFYNIAHDTAYYTCSGILGGQKLSFYVEDGIWGIIKNNYVPD